MGQSFNADFVDGSGETRLAGQLSYTGSNAASPPSLNQVSPVGTITSGSLSHITLVSGTEQQVVTTRDCDTYTLFTTDATNNAATCTVALSADDTTFTTLFAISIAAAVNNTGAVTIPVTVRVPAGWWLKMTFAHGTLSNTTYA